jgi:hypothetical protein
MGHTQQSLLVEDTPICEFDSSLEGLSGKGPFIILAKEPDEVTSLK